MESPWVQLGRAIHPAFMVDAAGKVTGRVVLNGARVDDWEALASGPSGNNS